MNNIKKQAYKLRKTVNGKIDIPNLISYLKLYGYSTVFYNTLEGDEILRAYKLPKNVEKAFTYCGSTSIVFLNNNLSTQDNIYSLLHEIAHIVLKHIGTGNIGLLNKREIKNEAEVFAYEVIHYKSNTKQILLAIVLILASFISGIAVSRISTPQPPETAETVSVSVHDNSVAEVPVLSVDESNEFVYVTPTGKRYHRSDCRYVKNKNCTELNIEQAIKNYTPCKVCNP